MHNKLAELNSDGFEVIWVSSGAVGLGRQRLRYRQLVNSSFADLQEPQMELDRKACAGVGQSSLMAYYETMFDQLDVTVAQMLVTDSSFRDKDFRKQLSETLKATLRMRILPVFNENDAISTRRAPYKEKRILNEANAVKKPQCTLAKEETASIMVFHGENLAPKHQPVRLEKSTTSRVKASRRTSRTLVSENMINCKRFAFGRKKQVACQGIETVEDTKIILIGESKEVVATINKPSVCVVASWEKRPATVPKGPNFHSILLLWYKIYMVT